MRGPMRIIVADDHPLYIEAVRGQLERAFPGAAVADTRSFDGAMALLAEAPADLVMVDLFMPGMSGADGVSHLVATAAGAPVVVMSGSATDSDVRACIEAGARGFLPKTFDSAVFASVVRLVIDGASYVPTEFMRATANAESEAKTLRANFTPRELEVLRYVVAGAPNKEIARKLDLQEVTIKLHMTRIFHKLGVKNRSHAAVVAVRSGLVQETC